MIDVALIKVKAGNGGNGCVSFRHEKSNFKGGPDGGDGGDGGNVYLVGESNLRTLDYFAGKQRFRADRGGHGRHKNQEGAKAENLMIKVSQGCVVYEIDGFDDAILSKKQLFEILRANKLQSEVIHSGGDNPNQKSNLKNQNVMQNAKLPDHPENEEALRSIPGYAAGATRSRDLRLIYIGEILDNGQELVVAKGGRGGRGNNAFKGPTNTTPREFEEGGKGQERWLVLELKMLADVGLVGLPNVGKSTLLSVLTNARPKIANYEFTTLEPNLGVLRRSTKSQAPNFKQYQISKIKNQNVIQNAKSSGDLEVVIADIPGLIEGASKGKGLGDEFLRHVERCGLLVHVVAPKLNHQTPSTNGQTINQIPNTKNRKDDKEVELVVEQLVKDYETVREELGDYYPKLLEKPEVVVVNKIDLLDADLSIKVKAQIVKLFEKNGVEKVLFVSAGTREGIEELENLLCKSQG